MANKDSNHNVISNSSINVGGNMHIGDIINIHLNQPSENPVQDFIFGKEAAEEVKNLISKGQMESAFDILLSNAKKSDTQIFNEIIALAKQWEDLQRETRIGLLSTDEKFRLASRITFSLLQSTDQLAQKN
jgi:hypothetical protein